MNIQMPQTPSHVNRSVVVAAISNMGNIIYRQQENHFDAMDTIEFLKHLRSDQEQVFRCLLGQPQMSSSKGSGSFHETCWNEAIRNVQTPFTIMASRRYGPMHIVGGVGSQAIQEEANLALSFREK